jgi:hypothetical protein
VFFFRSGLVALVLTLLTPLGLRAQELDPNFIPIPRSSGPIDGYIESSPQDHSLDQITAVADLRDVALQDWAYEALRSLVERYGCIVGYPDQTFRGDRALSRWEFAAGLNACLSTLEKLVQENVAVLRSDLDTARRLAESFQGELQQLGARVDNLENRLALLEDHQFSTTTKLTGQVVMAFNGIASGKRDNGAETIPQVPTLGYRSRLELNTSFTGKDDLFMRLTSGTLADLAIPAQTFQATLGYTQPEDSNLFLEVLSYHFPVAEDVRFWVSMAGGTFNDFATTNNFLDGDGAVGSFTLFGTRSPLYFMGSGAGVALQGMGDTWQWSLGYLARDAANPETGKGLFDGAYGAIAQVGYNVTDRFGVALTYTHGYNTLDTNTGSQRSNFQFFTEEFFGEPVKTIHNAYGLEFTWRVWDHFVFGGWGGLTKAQTLNAIDQEDFSIGRGNLDIWNWALTFAFPDVFKEGNVAGFIIGMQPWVSASNIALPDNLAATDQDTSLHLETFFQWQVTDNLSLTPGILVIPNADYNSANGTLVVGAVRATFEF